MPWVGPKCEHVSMSEGVWGPWMKRPQGRPCVDRGRDQSDVAVMPGDSTGASAQRVTCNTLIWDLRSPELGGDKLLLL